MLSGTSLGSTSTAASDDEVAASSDAEVDDTFCAAAADEELVSASSAEEPPNSMKPTAATIAKTSTATAQLAMTAIFFELGGAAASSRATDAWAGNTPVGSTGVMGAVALSRSPKQANPG